MVVAWWPCLSHLLMVVAAIIIKIEYYDLLACWSFVFACDKTSHRQLEVIQTGGSIGLHNVLFYIYIRYLPRNCFKSSNLKTADSYRNLLSILKVAWLWCHNTLVIYYSWRECETEFNPITHIGSMIWIFQSGLLYLLACIVYISF